MIKNKRYQECSLLEKIWRRRYQLLIPYYAFRSYIKSNSLGNSWSECWDIEIGTSHYRMNWWYTGKEVEEYLKKDQKSKEKLAK